MSSIAALRARQYCTALDAKVASLAADQHGVVTLAQLRQLGLSGRAVQARAARGALHRVHRGVYAVGHPLLGPDGRRMAAVLACGPGAVLSHRSAAAAWGFRATDRVRHEVTTADRGRRHRPGIEVRYASTLTSEDITVLRGIPITSVARTFVDLAGVITRESLDRSLHEAEVLGLLDARAFDDAMARTPNARGVGTLRAALRDPVAGVTRSALEDRFLRLCHKAALRPPRTNVHLRVDGRLIEVDALWPDVRLVVELDGAAFHRTARAFERDRRRDALLVAHGYVVVRLTWRRIADEPDAVVAELRAILVRRAAMQH
jgi:very-short-patch-repair endonuclease